MLIQSGAKLHPLARMYARECGDGKLSRREFLTRATAMGLSSAAAYGLIGLTAPSAAQANPVAGGTLRLNMETKAMKDPITWDWAELANFARGWLEYLVQYNRDGTLTPILLESWEVNNEATEYTLNLRRGIKWNNGADFTAEDVAFNIKRWCDGSIEGNSMAARMSALQDPETNQIGDGVMTIIDQHTIKLNLVAPDISIIVGAADYPAVIVHRSYDGGSPADNPIGTGAYLPAENEVGIRQVLVKNPDHTYWREGGWLDRVEFIDYGTDASSVVAAAEAEEIDMTFRIDGDFVQVFDSIGWQKSEAVTASTAVARFQQTAEPYGNREVRRALQMAVDNAFVLELGFAGLGSIAENHHVCPLHPEYVELPPLTVDRAMAKAMIDEAGLSDHEFELISVDINWQANSCDAIAAQLRDAGIKVKRTMLPGSTFWNDWTKYPWSMTEWNMRPLGVQVLALAYKSGVPWNETGFTNTEFDTVLAEALGVADADKRSVLMKRLEEIMQEEGVIIQPYWRKVFRHHNGKVGNADMHPLLEIHIHEYFMTS